MFKQRDMYLIKAGRKATSFGLLALIIGVILSKIMELNPVLMVMIPLVFAYCFLSFYWGGYKANLWFNKYKYRMPSKLWLILRYPVIVLGAITGILLWGFMEHFFLLMAIMTKLERGLILSQLILCPVLGRWVARRV